jgi:probable HAF family extracellular repeat protein
MKTSAHLVAGFTASVMLLLGAGQAFAQSYVFTDLGTLGGTSSAALGINNGGQVVGRANVTNNFGEHAVIWDGATITDLGTAGAFFGNSYGVGINDAGKVVGDSYNPFAPGNDNTGTLWNGTSPAALGTLGGSFSGAQGINNSGQITGFSHIAGNSAAHATIWNGNGTTITDIDGLGGNFSVGASINDAGHVVGQAATAVGQFHAFRYDGTAMQDLGT